MSHVTGIILAAGTSSRLGRPKQLLLLDGKPLVRIVTENAAASELDDVVVVVGHYAVEISEAVSDLGVRVIENARYAEGQSTSLHAGLRALTPDTEAALFLLSDQPEIGVDAIDAVIANFRSRPGLILRARYDETPGHPVLIARSLFAELLETDGDEAARPVLSRHANETGWVDITEAEAPGDVDTDADYDALKARWAARMKSTL